MGHKVIKILEAESLTVDEQNKLSVCVCGSTPVFSYDPNIDVYTVKCSKEGCPAKASSNVKETALNIWQATVTKHF